MFKEQLVFGQIPAQEQTSRRRRRAARRKTPENQEVYQAFRSLPLIEETLRADWRRWQEQAQQKDNQRQEVLEAIYGPGVKVPEQIHPSTASFCLRWVAYRALGYKEAEPEVKSISTMKMGSSIHWSYGRTMKDFLPGEAEASVVVGDPDLSGRIDYFFANPRWPDQYQILEFKSVSVWGFRQIKREGLPDYLQGTKDIYQPSPEHRKQTLLYMWAKSRHHYNVICANIIYINRSSGEMKEALIPWDALAEYDVEEVLVPQIRQTQAIIEDLKKKKAAGQPIDEQELPEPTVESAHVCGRFCPFRGRCEFGQKFAGGEVRRKAKRRPQYVYRKLKEDRQQVRGLMEKAGLVQGGLPGFELPPRRRSKRERATPEKRKRPVYCGECGGEMVRDRRGIACCPHCGGGA